jgi:hypothetical protein
MYVHVPIQPIYGSFSTCIAERRRGSNYISDGSTIFEPSQSTLVVLWIVLTVTALHKPDSWFWSLWFHLDKCHLLSDRPRVAEHLEPVARPERARLPRAYNRRSSSISSHFYNYNVTMSATLAISTGILHQLTGEVTRWTAVAERLAASAVNRQDHGERRRWHLHRESFDRKIVVTEILYMASSPDLTHALYADPPGMNRRNETVHGLVDADRFYFHLGNLIVHSLLMLGLWKEFGQKR